ncbi:MAG: SufE family protein [Candidatus Shikimatogenerans bostrichidophilus]|nr:MAG: SufE family protein [Candidatus Shikimatogenerans bostrichidophilus]
MFEKNFINKIKNNNIYNLLINYGKKIPFYPQKYKINKYLLNDCQTNVWLFFFYKKKKIFILGKSNSNIINGIIYLIIKIYSNKTPIEILKYKTKLFNKIKLEKILSINRYIGILNIIKKVKLNALKYINFKK